MNINAVVLVGRLVRDPELRVVDGDLACCNFTLAVNRKVKRRDGSMIEEATFIDAAMFGPRARSFAEHHRRGDHAAISRGRLKTDRWMDGKTGEERSKLVVVVEDWEFAGGQRRPDPENPL